MIKNGDYIMYSLHGACKVVGLEEREENNKVYYELVPQNNKVSKILVPVDNDKIRPILTREEAEELLNSVEYIDAEWIPDNSTRANTYNQIVKEGNSKEQLEVLRSLLRKQREKGTRLTMQDRKIIENTEKLLVSELSVVLGLEEKEVKKIITMD